MGSMADHTTSDREWGKCRRIFNDLKSMCVPEIRIRTLWEKNKGDVVKIEDELASRMELASCIAAGNLHRQEEFRGDESVCAICQEDDLQSSSVSLVLFDCGHAIHSQCANEMLRIAHRDAPDTVLLIDCPYGQVCSGKLHFQESERNLHLHEMSETDSEEACEMVKLWRWYLNIVKHQVLRVAGWLECESPECHKSGILVKIEHSDCPSSCDSNRVVCAACGADYCSSCSVAALRTVESHNPLPCNARISMKEVYRVIAEQASPNRSFFARGLR
eukprot:2914846-Rhodomonas_salina.2